MSLLTELTTRKLQTEVLRQVNDIRVAVGIGEGTLKKLPKGIRNKSRECVIARALSNGWEPKVETSFIRLYHFGDPKVKWNLIKHTLEGLGFKNVFIISSRKNPYGYGYVEFNTTQEMKKLIELFDSGKLKSLIA